MTAEVAIVSAAVVAVAWLWRGASLARSDVLAQLRDAERDRSQAWRDVTAANLAAAEQARAVATLTDRVVKVEDKIQGVLFRIGGGR